MVVAANGPGVVVAPTIRSSQPVRSDEPGAARSISSMSVKCERVGLGWPTACTIASLPAVYSGSSGASEGCSANRLVSGRPRDMRHGDVGPGGVVLGVADRGHGGQPVEPAAEGEHDEGVTGVAGIREGEAGGRLRGRREDAGCRERPEPGRTGQDAAPGHPARGART